MLTLALLVFGTLIESVVDINNKAWMYFESVINYPGKVMLMIVGPGHGFRQLVLPFVFSLAFYIAFFWLIVVLLRRLWNVRRS